LNRRGCGGAGGCSGARWRRDSGDCGSNGGGGGDAASEYTPNTWSAGSGPRVVADASVEARRRSEADMGLHITSAMGGGLSSQTALPNKQFLIILKVMEVNDNHSRCCDDDGLSDHYRQQHQSRFTKMRWAGEVA
jgi:hypothetical protein